MAKFVLKDASVTVSGSDISDHASSVALEDTAEEIDFSTFSASSYREFGQGLKDANITVTVFNDDAAAGIDSLLAPLYTSGGTFDVVIKRTSATVSATNPTYTMKSRLYSYTPLSGAIGEASTSDLTFRNAGTAGIVRGTA